MTFKAVVPKLQLTPSPPGVPRLPSQACRCQRQGEGFDTSLRSMQTMLLALELIAKEPWDLNLFTTISNWS